jgi:hypothetical protein
MLSEMQRAAMIRNELVDLDGLIRLEGVARRAVADMRQLAREVRGEVQPSMTNEEHIRTTYGQRRDVGLPETPGARLTDWGPAGAPPVRCRDPALPDARHRIASLRPRPPLLWPGPTDGGRGPPGSTSALFLRRLLYSLLSQGLIELGGSE